MSNGVVQPLQGFAPPLIYGMNYLSYFRGLILQVRSSIREDA
jgi:hypothetical protein